MRPFRTPLLDRHPASSPLFRPPDHARHHAAAGASDRRQGRSRLARHSWSFGWSGIHGHPLRSRRRGAPGGGPRYVWTDAHPRIVPPTLGGRERSQPRTHFPHQQERTGLGRSTVGRKIGCLRSWISCATLSLALRRGDMAADSRCFTVADVAPAARQANEIAQDSPAH